jgi:hypothetical protein
MTESTFPQETVDLALEFQRDPGAFAPLPAFLVVKSQDQLVRRQRLIEAVKCGRIGRIEERPVAEGLLVQTTIRPGVRIDRRSAQRLLTFREPRGLALSGDGTLLVSEIDRVINISAEGTVLRQYQLPGFGFLHAIELSPDGRRLLVVSSGYDLLVELDLATGKPVWDWLSWEHGFNPSQDGVYLARDQSRYQAFCDAGLPAQLVDLSDPDSHGLMTSVRTNHPNSACYVPDQEGVILVTLGHSGEVIEIARPAGEWNRVITGLAAMAHGIQPYRAGWMVTNTLRGQCWFLDRGFQLVRRLDFANLPGKPPELGDSEWLQCVCPVGDEVFAGLDANRGIVLLDVRRRVYDIVSADENWCLHLIVPDRGRE